MGPKKKGKGKGKGKKEGKGQKGGKTVAEYKPKKSKPRFSYQPINQLLTTN